MSATKTLSVLVEIPRGERNKYEMDHETGRIDPDALTQALNDSRAIATYKEYVRAYGLGWKVEAKDTQRFPESALLQPLRYASVPQEESKQ